MVMSPSLEFTWLRLSAKQPLKLEPSHSAACILLPSLPITITIYYYTTAIDSAELTMWGLDSIQMWGRVYNLYVLFSFTLLDDTLFLKMLVLN